MPYRKSRLVREDGSQVNCLDIIERVALLIRYGTIRMAERCRVCGRWLAETDHGVGGLWVEAFGKYCDLTAVALTLRSLFDFGIKNRVARSLRLVATFLAVRSLTVWGAGL
jgi:hypothetical protein